MRKLIAAAVFLAVAVPVSRADDAADKAAKTLEGTYTVVEVTRGGKPEPKAKEVEAFVIKDGTITIKTKQRDEPGKFTLDPSKTPAHIDLKADEDRTMAGIYRTKDTADGFELTIAVARKGDRPKDFKGAGEDEMVVKLLRKKAEK